MKKYIEVDSLVTTMETVAIHRYPIVEALIKFIKDFPTADVIEARRGRWIRDIQDKKICCSICGSSWIIPMKSYLHFCPNCGADMRDADNDD